MPRPITQATDLHLCHHAVSRRLLLAGLMLLLFVAGAALANADEDLAVLSPDAGGVAPSSMLHAHLMGQTKVLFDERRAAIAALKTPESVRDRQRDLRTRFLAAIGEFPEKTPLNAQVTGTARQEGYRIEKIVFESRPQHHVTAVLYLPDGPPPFPGVLVPCGHSANGKAAEPYQRACILMAKNGIAVLCYDPIGQGERVQLLDAMGKPGIPGSTSEHTMIGIGALLVGQSTAGYRIWDGIRSLDYLASRPEIDPLRLGCTGNSGGGTLTAYLMALDDRILAAAPSCYITSLERLFETLGPQDAEQNITGQVAFGMDHADYVTMRAPRPTLICTGTRDFFDIQGAWTTFREAKRTFGMLGHGERVDLFEFDDPHGFSLPRREAAMRWMRRWLLQKDDAPSEPDFPIFKDPELLCTRTGQVLEEFKGVSAFDLNADRDRQLAQTRTQSKRSRDALLNDARRLTAVAASPPDAKLTEGASLERSGYRIRKLIFETEPGIRVAGLMFVPEGADDAGQVVIYLHGDGKATDAQPGGPIERLVKAGQRVLALDLRGMGETTPESNRRNSAFGGDVKEAFLGLHINRPLLGQRVLDLLAVVEEMTSTAPQGFHLIGIGSAGPIALHAAAFEPRIRQLTLERSIVSWSDVVRTPISRDQLTNVVPGVLTHYDLPDLAAALAPRPLTIREPVDPAGKRVPLKALEEAYASCKSEYARQKAEKELLLQAGATGE